MKTRLMQVLAKDVGPATRVFIPADRLASDDCEEARFGLGNLLEAELRKSRNPGYHRLVHALGSLAAENCEAFASCNGNAHAAVKRLQLETGCECDEILIKSDFGDVPYRIPRSIEFGKMGQERFEKLARTIAGHLQSRYKMARNAEEIIAMCDDIIGGQP